MHIEQHNLANSDECISVDHLSYRYHNDLVLDDVTFKVRRGDYVGIIGPNGGGKTTLLKTMLGLLKPSTGSVTVFGRDVHALKEERGHIGYVPQRASQIDANFPASVEEIVASGRTARIGVFRKFSDDDRAAIDRALDISGMSRFRRRLISELSGGERQRAFIARAIAGDPQVLFLDEPSVGIDIASQEQFFSFVAALNHEHGLTIVLVSHDIDVVANEVHTLLALNRKVVCFGPAKDLLNENYIKDLYGSRVNFAFHGH